jgi:hypothetical protein
MDIPPSPPPPATPAEEEALKALNEKVESFLKLKRRSRDPAHFNARLAGSAAARNPELMEKLMMFAGVEDSDAAEDSAGNHEYATTLSRDIWDPLGFPAWAYKDELRRTADKVAKEKERGKGEKVEFVPATAETPAVTGKRKTRFDT